MEKRNKERAALKIQSAQRKRQAVKRTEVLRKLREERLQLAKAREKAMLEAARKAREAAIRRRQEQQREADELAAINGIKARRIGGGYVALRPRTAEEIEQIKERLRQSAQKYGAKRKKPTKQKVKARALEAANAIRERNRVSFPLLGEQDL